MQAGNGKLLHILTSPQQFIIPIYQRTYSWEKKQCQQLWDDVIRCGTDKTSAEHFVGSIVYVPDVVMPPKPVELNVIDGQQRLTTVSLLLAALGNAVKDKPGIGFTRESIFNQYLLNQFAEGVLKYKLWLTRGDRETYINVIEGKEQHADASRRIVENYRFFEDKIARSGVDVQSIFQGIAKLNIVLITLEHGDNPQMIFESLNSTGMDLSHADLVRNFILMGLKRHEQEDIYKNIWYKMEKNFATLDSKEHFDYFMRDYLTIRTGKIPVMRDIYDSFKEYLYRNPDKTTRQIAEDIYHLSKYYCTVASPENDYGLECKLNDKFVEAMKDINTLRVDVVYPFLITVFDDYTNGHLSLNDLIEILRVIESYVFRRYVCGFATNSLTNTFWEMIKEIDRNDYVNGVEASLLAREAHRRFPRDDEFMKAFIEKDLYHGRNNFYVLKKLEEHNNPEPVNFNKENITIEHILPQNENLNPEWQRDLGPGWKLIHSKYVNTIGNLTLTGSNSPLSDNPFLIKCNLNTEPYKGFKFSNISITRYLGDIEVWNEEQINKRANMLAQLALKIWLMPMLTDEKLEKYKPAVAQHVESHTIEDTLVDKGQLMKDVFAKLREYILGLDSRVVEDSKKSYIAYKLNTNFADVIVQKNSLLVFLNMAYDDISDPKNIAKRTKNPGSRANGEVEIPLFTLDQVDDVKALIVQSYLKQKGEIEKA